MASISTIGSGGGVGAGSIPNRPRTADFRSRNAPGVSGIQLPPPPPPIPLTPRGVVSGTEGGGGGGGGIRKSGVRMNEFAPTLIVHVFGRTLSSFRVQPICTNSYSPDNTICPGLKVAVAGTATPSDPVATSPGVISVAPDPSALALFQTRKLTAVVLLPRPVSVVTSLKVHVPAGIVRLYAISDRQESPAPFGGLTGSSETAF